MTGGPPAVLADIHVHPALPWIGPTWRRHVQGFRLASLDRACGEGDHPAGGIPPPGPEPALRLYGAAFYQTCPLRPAAARKNLFDSLKAFHRRLSRPGAGRLIRSAPDLESFLSPAPSPPAPEACGEGFFLTVESLRCIGDPADIGRLWDLGVRSLQPIHFLDNPWGGSSREGFLPESREGLSGLGRELLAEMAGPGFILDIAHMSRRNAEQCLAAYPGPVMCSHTGYPGRKASARNVDADLAREIFRRKGIVGVTYWRHLLGPDPEPRRDSLRAAWTRSFCATAAAFAALSPDARVAVGSDRGAPIWAPAWIHSRAHIAEMEARLSGLGWNPPQVRALLGGSAGAFLAGSLPVRGT